MSFNITTDIFNVYEEEIRVYYSSSGKASKIMGGGKLTQQQCLNNYKQMINQLCSNFDILEYENMNYLSYTFFNYKNFTIVSSTNYISGVNRWMYPLEKYFYHIHTLNIPITRTISIIINSNTLPVYTIPEITVDLEYLGSKKQLIIPEGSYNYSSFNQVFYNYFKSIFNSTMSFTNYLDIPYFEYTRYITGGESNTIIRDNTELNKYYGLLHMIYTIPDSVNIYSGYKFPCNMAPVYRSLSIPDGTYTPYELIDYVNTNSSYSYNLNGIPSLSYTQFLAKVVDNDVVIYTNDNTEFFINPICSINKYKESDWSKEHKLCSCPYEILSYRTENKYFLNQEISISPVNPDNLKNFSATNLPDGLTIDANSGVISGIISTDNLYKKYNIVVTSGIISANVNMNIIKKNRTIIKNNKYDYIVITK